ncbi:MAG: helix-turn-helix domain-containing protein [Bryobacteraceae bacterium]
MAKKDDAELIARFADMLSAMGTEPRLRIVRLLLSAHPEGMVVGDIGGELDIPSSTLSHHLEKLRNEDLVSVRARRYLPLVFGQHGSTPGIAWFSVCRVLHPKQGDRARQDPVLQVKIG